MGEVEDAALAEANAIEKRRQEERERSLRERERSRISNRKS